MNETLGKVEDYSAFYVACPRDHFDTVAQAVVKENPTRFLVCSEISSSSHQDTSGHHVHVLATLDDIQYRRIIHTLKKILNLRGRATASQSRSYGKVKLIRDLMKMGAYTLKAQDPSGMLFSNFPDYIITQMIELSYEKERITDIETELLQYISENINEIEERNAYTHLTEKNVPFQTQQEDHHIKQAIIQFYRKHADGMKLPTRSRVNYYATKWALHHSGWNPDKIVYYFFR